MHFRELKLHITNNPIIPLVLFLFFYYFFVSISICKDVVLVQDIIEGLTQIQIRFR